MSQHNIAPKWDSNPHWHIPDQAAHEQEATTPPPLSSHVQNQTKPSYLIPHNMSNYEVAELTWKNGQPSIHGSAEPIWGRSSPPSHDTLESIVHQAKSLNHKAMISPQATENAAEEGKWVEESEEKVQMNSGLSKKRLRSEAVDDCGRYLSRVGQLHDHETAAERGGCASASATFCRGDDTHASMRASRVSLDSPRSLTMKSTLEDSDFHGCSKEREENQQNDGENVRSHPTSQNRVADVHNESERRRRDRINQKMKALQKLVPNSCKTDKASMLDEVIEYLKKLKAQVHLMSSRTIPQMMMNPLAMQQLQMPLLSGIGILDTNPMAPYVPTVPMGAAAPTLLPGAAVILPPTVVPYPAPLRAANSDASHTTSFSFRHPYAGYFSQQQECMNFCHEIAMLYGQGHDGSNSGHTTKASEQNLTPTG